MAWMALGPGNSPADEVEVGKATRLPAEWRLHRDLYRQRADVAAIIRSRPAFCTTLACIDRVQQEGIPAFHPDVVLAAGGAVRCAAAAPPDSSASFEHIAAALVDRAACLLAARGLLTTGATLQAAAQRAAELETLAQIYWQFLLASRAP